MDKCKKCQGSMDPVPDVFTPHLQCRVCRDIVYLTLDGEALDLIKIGNAQADQKYSDIRWKVEYLIDKGFTNPRIAKILDVTTDIIYRRTKAYRIKTGQLSPSKFHRKPTMAGAAQ